MNYNNENKYIGEWKDDKRYGRGIFYAKSFGIYIFFLCKISMNTVFIHFSLYFNIRN
jgi:hypothetical protein